MLGPMSVHRVMGLETEFGISHPGHPNANPVRMSGLVVNAHAVAVGRTGALAQRWDYDEESPLRDARGFDMTRAEADPSQLTDDVGTANVVLTNGARFYVDHAHPEYSSPEVTNPWDAVVWDRAGTQIAAEAARCAASLPGGHEIVLYKNNTDGKGASYGTHENYLMDRRTPFKSVVDALIPFFVTRQVFTGAGRVGLGQDGRREGFQLSSRADFFEVEVGLETTLKRPIINTRDEPHADPALWRRLHVIVGDANLSETATLLKLGTTAIVLSMIEAGGPNLGIELANPVAAMHRVSHDLSLREPLDCLRRSPLTALEVQQAYLEAARVHCAGQPGRDRSAHRRGAGPLGRGPGRAGHRAARAGRPARLGRQARAARRVPAPRRTGLVGSAAGGDRPAVRRHPHREGPGPPAGAARVAAPDHHRRRGRPSRRGAAHRHPRLVPGRVRPTVR